VADSEASEAPWKLMFEVREHPIPAASLPVEVSTFAPTKCRRTVLPMMATDDVVVMDAFENSMSTFEFETWTEFVGESPVITKLNT
jgi:hypothetical protein